VVIPRIAKGLPRWRRWSRLWKNWLTPKAESQKRKTRRAAIKNGSQGTIVMSTTTSKIQLVKFL
jgi:hypothetical protein